MRSPTVFAVPPPPAYAWLLLVLLGGVIPIGLMVGMHALHMPMNGEGLAWVVVLAVLAGLLLSMRRRTVLLRDGVLEVRAAFYRKRVAVTELDIERARVVDLAERTELRPAVKTNGISMPGYHAGHFRIHRKLEKAFCLLTDRRRVLWLPLRDGGQLLLSLERPQALLDALHAAR
jgi:hypothetical protein